MFPSTNWLKQRSPVRSMPGNLSFQRSNRKFRFYSCFVRSGSATSGTKMILTKRQHVSVGEMITEEFMVPLGINQGQLASAMGVSRRTVNELCTGKRSITVDTALMLAKVFGNTPNFWLNLQQRNDLWTALHSSKRMEKIERVRPIRETTA